MSKLFSMGLTKAYIIVTIIGTVPAVVFGIFFYNKLGSYGDQTAQLQTAAGGAGSFKAGAIPDNIDYTHNVGLWIGGVVLTFLFAGALLRIVLGNVTLKTSENMISEMRRAATGDLSGDPKVSMSNEYGDLQRLRRAARKLPHDDHPHRPCLGRPAPGRNGNVTHFRRSRKLDRRGRPGDQRNQRRRSAPG
jgi:hypothetical protein